MGLSLAIEEDLVMGGSESIREKETLCMGSDIVSEGEILKEINSIVKIK